MEKAGWYLTQGGGHFQAKDGQGRTVFSVTADSKGLYYLNTVTILESATPTTTTSADVRGQRKFPEGIDNLKPSQFFAMGVNDKNCQVKLLPSANVCRLEVPQATRCDTDSHLFVQSCERREQRHLSPVTLSLHLPPMAKPQGLRVQTCRRPVGSLGEGECKHVAFSICTSGSSELSGDGNVQSALNPSMPLCYFNEPCVWCLPPDEDQASPAVAVSAKETKRLMDAHVRFGHRNFRSLAKALNMRMPSKIPFCQACVEAKSTRHPKSVSPRPLREPAPRPGYRLHFDPFGPFPERLADGSFYGLLFADAYSTVLWFDTLPTLKHWFAHLKALILKIESDKASERVVAQLASDSAPMFKNSYEYRRYADSKGIALLFSAPYTQKFNAPVERPIRTLVDMAVAMARHANTPKRFMHLAMKFAVRLLNRLFRRMPDGSTDVPLWRDKGARVGTP